MDKIETDKGTPILYDRPMKLRWIVDWMDKKETERCKIDSY